MSSNSHFTDFDPELGILTGAEQAKLRLVDELISDVRASIRAQIPKLPENYGSVELRELVADAFDSARLSHLPYAAKRVADYQRFRKEIGL